jgi:hypothetical protein
MFLLELGQSREVMEEWPERAIAKPVVKAVHAFFGQKDWTSFEMGLPKLLYGGLLIGRNVCPRPSHPQKIKPSRRVRASAIQVTPQSGRQPARTGGELRLAVFDGYSKRQPIRSNDQTHNSSSSY